MGKIKITEKVIRNIKLNERIIRLVSKHFTKRRNLHINEWDDIYDLAGEMER